MITVQIVDDHKMFVEGIVKIINESGVAQIVGKAYSARECMQMLSRQQADILLLDIYLPDGNGIDLCAKIKGIYPDIKIMALTSFSEYSVVQRMLANGASGYILKNSLAEEIIEGIEVLSTGEKYICDDVAHSLKKQTDTAVVLTGKERELLRLIVDGNINTEIAQKMFLGVETVNSYRKNLLFKLQARNTAVLVKIALQQKLI